MNKETVKRRLEELINRNWEIAAIEKRFQGLLERNRSGRTTEKAPLSRNNAQRLDRVQRLAEEYTYLGANCPRGTALALMDEFDIVSVDLIRGLAPFPGIAGTGSICGGLTGSMAVFGLIFASDDIRDQKAVEKSIAASQMLIQRFTATIGMTECSKIQEKLLFGRYMDIGASEENAQKFMAENGIAKCALLPGIGARIAAEIIIDMMG